MAMTVLLTGFGPFPGAPFNPSGPLVRALARRRRPMLADVKRIPHVFATSYDAVDRDLPRLLARHRPDIVLMFGLATRTPHLRIEMQARNAVSRLLPDAGGLRREARAITIGGASRAIGNAPFVRLLAAARGWTVPAKLSRDAGRYLCNFAYWRGLEAVGARSEPMLVQFVHIPLVRRGFLPRARAKRRKPAPADLATAAEAMLVVLVSAARRR